jgi:hypothetical protein
MKIKIFTLRISSDGFFVIFAISIAYSPKGFLEIFTIANCCHREVLFVIELIIIIIFWLQNRRTF